jgi:hypothetical protein
MRFLQSVIFLLAFFASNTPLHAEYSDGRDCAPSELLIDIFVNRSEADQGTVCPHLDPRRRAFLHINGKGVIFNPDQLLNLYGPSTYDDCKSGNDGKRTEGIWRGCVAKSVFKVEGQNSFAFQACPMDLNGNCSFSDYVDKLYVLKIRNERREFLKLFEARALGLGGAAEYKCNQSDVQSATNMPCALGVGTDTLLPDTMAAVRNLLSQSQQLKLDAEAKSRAADIRIEEAEKVIKSIQGKSFDQLTEADLAAFAEALAILRTERAKASELRAEVERQLEIIRTSLTETQTTAKVELASLGIDIDDSSTYTDLVDFDVSPAALPPLPNPDPIDPSDNVYKLLADKSLEAMLRAVESNNRTEFLQVTLSWSERNKALLDLYRPRLVASESERAEYELQTRRVESFLYGADGKPGVLDKNGWFRDSLVPADFQQIIDSMLARDANDPFAVWLKQTMRPLPGKQATIDGKTYSLILLSYSLVAYFNEFRKIYDEAVAQGYRPPPAAPPAVGQPNEFAGYSWETLTKAYLETQRSIEEIKKAGVMGIDLYVSTSLASPLVSFCRIVSGNSTCRFDGEKDLTGWDYLFSSVDSLALLVPIKAAVSVLKGLPSIGGKIFSVPSKILDVMESVQTKALELGLKATQETKDFVSLLGKVGIKSPGQLLEFVKYLHASKSIKQYLRIAKSVEPFEKIATKLEILTDIPVSGFYKGTIADAKIAETLDEFFLVRYYGNYKPGEVPAIGGITPAGASPKGSFWGTRLYQSERSFREGSVVFEEWNAAKAMTVIKVKKGNRIAFGKGLGQTLPPEKTFDGVAKALGPSEDWQFAFQPDQAWLDQGNKAEDWMNYLFEKGYLEIVEDVPTGWKK